MKSRNIGRLGALGNLVFPAKKRKESNTDFLCSRIENAEEFYFQQHSYAWITSLKSVSFPHDEGIVFSGDNEGNVGLVPLRCLDFLSKKEPPRSKPEIVSTPILARGGVTSLDYSYICEKLVITGDDGTVGTLSLDAGKTEVCLSHTWLGHSNIVNSADVHSTKDLIVTASHDGWAKLWDSRIQNAVGSMCTFPQRSSTARRGAQCARFCPRSHLVMVSWNSGMLDIWDSRRTKNPMYSWGMDTMASASYQVHCETSKWSDIRFSEDGLLLLHTKGTVFGGSTMVLYDVSNKKEIWNSSKEECGFQNSVKCPVFLSKGGLKVYGGDKDGNCFALDMKQQQKNGRKVNISQLYSCDIQDSISPIKEESRLHCPPPKKRKLDIVEKKHYPGVSIIHKHSSSLTALSVCGSDEPTYLISGDRGGELIFKSARFPMKLDASLEPVTLNSNYLLT